MNNRLLALACCALVACTSEGIIKVGALSADANIDQVDINVAAKKHGATIMASNNARIAEYVIDGDTTASQYWSGQRIGDYLTIDLGKAVSASSMTIYTNDISYSSSSPIKTIDVSSDNETWLRTLVPFGGGSISCPTYHSGNGKIFCQFGLNQEFRYLKVMIVGQREAGPVKIYEIEVMGH